MQDHKRGINGNIRNLRSEDGSHGPGKKKGGKPGSEVGRDIKKVQGFKETKGRSQTGEAEITDRRRGAKVARKGMAIGSRRI